MRGGGVARAAGVALLAVAAVRARPARAHPMNVARAEVELREREVDVALSLDLFQLDLLLSLDRDGDGEVDAAEIASARSRILEYLGGRVSVASRGSPLPLELAAPMRPGRAGDGRGTVEIEARFRGGEPLADVAIRCEPLAELGADHRTLARVAGEGAAEEVVFEGGSVYRRAAAGAARPFAQLVRLGVVHIFTGYDHVLFLLALLLAGGALPEVLKIVTSFTVAHSLTLSLAVLGLVRVPSRLVEAGIAASIACVALENLARGRPGRRWPSSLGFGLVHGLGFAAVLADMHLPRGALAASLLAFNAGVEVGQVAIVLACLPLLAWLRRSAAHRWVVTAASACILATGLYWLVERAL